MFDAPLAFAFGAGLIAAFNPCGFAMLPAYLAYFVGHEEGSRGGVGRALAVGSVVAAGFALVFGIAGLLVTQFSIAVSSAAPWFTIVVGAGLVPLGIALARGYEPRISLPRLQRGGRDRGLGSMFVFGSSYATVSLSCTLPVFLAAVSTTFRRANFASGMAVFGAYALGTGLVLVVLTLALSLARAGLVRRMRGALRYVNRASGALLVLAGAYVLYYGIEEVRLAGGAQSTGGGPIAWAGRWSGRIQTWLADTGPVRVGLWLGAAAAAAVAAGLVARRVRRRAET